ncbi:MAG: glycosyltransferase, partial [Thermoplasmatota archaeon]
MKIAMFTDTWLPTMDGVVNSIIQFRKCLENEGHEVFIFAPGKEDRVDPDDDHIFRFKGKTFNMYPEYRLALYPSKRTHDLLVENDIDIIHNHGVAFMGIKAMIAAKFFDLPCVFNFHTKVTEAVHYYPVNLSEALLKRLTWIYLRYLLRRSSAVIAPSEQALKELEEKCPNMRYSDVVAPGIDKDRYHKDVDGSVIRKNMDLDGSDVLLHVGRISKEKNLDLILDALPILKKKNGNAKFLIVGDGPAKEYYERHVREKGLEDVVTFTGFVPEKQLPKYYAASDAFVISSRFETLGIVLIEALATGTVVAGIDHGVRRPDLRVRL